jgi:hypothetical protein
MSSDESSDDDPALMLMGRKKSGGLRDELARKIIDKQLGDVPTNKRLLYKDIQRICKNIKTSIFDKEICCKWQGHVTNMNNLNKGRYVNFYFRKKKVALHRLLYINFVGPLSDEEYLKYKCENKGICCNILHLKKFKYQKNPKDNTGSDSSDTDDDSDNEDKPHRGKSKSVSPRRVYVVNSAIKDADWLKYKHKLTLNLD